MLSFACAHVCSGHRCSALSSRFCVLSCPLFTALVSAWLGFGCLQLYVQCWVELSMLNCAPLESGSWLVMEDVHGSEQALARLGAGC